jgi:hypothetical protein
MIRYQGTAVDEFESKFTVGWSARSLPERNLALAREQGMDYGHNGGTGRPQALGQE